MVKCSAQVICPFGAAVTSPRRALQTNSRARLMPSNRRHMTRCVADIVHPPLSCPDLLYAHESAHCVAAPPGWRGRDPSEELWPPQKPHSNEVMSHRKPRIIQEGEGHS